MDTSSQQNICIREVECIDDLAAVYEMTYREYVSAGYTAENESGELRQYPQLDGIHETTVLGAYIKGELAGTNSLTVDGPMGLHVDHDFPDIVSRIRRWCVVNHLRLGASWRIVTDSRFHHHLRILTELVRATIRKGCSLGLHVTLYSFNPKHESVYRRFLGLETIARDVCRAADGAPAVLMLGDSRVITKRCARLVQPCMKDCVPPNWPRTMGRWMGETTGVCCLYKN